MVDSIEMLKRYVSIHPRLETLLVYHEKPLSIIYTEIKNLPDEILSEKRSIAVRVTLDPFCREIITMLDRPLISTSANVSGEPYPRNFHEISSPIIRNMDYIVNYRQNDFSENFPSVLAEFNRRGELSFLRE
jgi:L-threonylcarbamoyladenylate synthase